MDRDDGLGIRTRRAGRPRRIQAEKDDSDDIVCRVHIGLSLQSGPRVGLGLGRGTWDVGADSDLELGTRRWYDMRWDLGAFHGLIGGDTDTNQGSRAWLEVLV